MRSVPPPGPRTLNPLGSYLPFARDPLGFLDRVRREHGPVARFRMGPIGIWLVAEPELIREVLVVRAASVHKPRGLEAAKVVLGEGLLTSDGESWRRRRRLTQPGFHAERLRAYAAVMARRARERVARWRDGEVVDAAAEMARLALEIVAEALFGQDRVEEIEPAAAAVSEAVDAFRIGRIPIAKLLDRLPIPPTRRLHAARDTLDAIVYRFIADRRARPGDDLLSLLLAAKDEEGGPGLSDREVRDEVMTLFLAGHETTANALAWAIDLVGRDRRVQERLEAEAERAGDLAEAALAGAAPAVAGPLELARRVVTETMRLRPPAWNVARSALEDFPLGPYTVRARDTVVTPQWVVHRDARFFPEPERFLPDRWSPEGRAALPRLAYFPFGAGPRQCLGEGFAWAEAAIALAAIAREVRLVPVSPAPPTPVPRITLRPGGGVPVRVLRRRR
ncbi:MAG: cytochrome P450 [Anaeromyxobacter sp.]